MRVVNICTAKNYVNANLPSSLVKLKAYLLVTTRRLAMAVQKPITCDFFLSCSDNQLRILIYYKRQSSLVHYQETSVLKIRQFGRGADAV